MLVLLVRTSLLSCERCLHEGPSGALSRFRCTSGVSGLGPGGAEGAEQTAGRRPRPPGQALPGEPLGAGVGDDREGDGPLPLRPLHRLHHGHLRHYRHHLDLEQLVWGLSWTFK